MGAGPAFMAGLSDSKNAIARREAERREAVLLARGGGGVDALLSPSLVATWLVPPRSDYAELVGGIGGGVMRGTTGRVRQVADARGPGGADFRRAMLRGLWERALAHVACVALRRAAQVASARDGLVIGILKRRTAPLAREALLALRRYAAYRRRRSAQKEIQLKAAARFRGRAVGRAVLGAWKFVARQLAQGRLAVNLALARRGNRVRREALARWRAWHARKRRSKLQMEVAWWWHACALLGRALFEWSAIAHHSAVLRAALTGQPSGMPPVIQSREQREAVVARAVLRLWRRFTPLRNVLRDLQMPRRPPPLNPLDHKKLDMTFSACERSLTTTLRKRNRLVVQVSSSDSSTGASPPGLPETALIGSASHPVSTAPPVIDLDASKQPPEDLEAALLRRLRAAGEETRRRRRLRVGLPSEERDVREAPGGDDDLSSSSSASAASSPGSVGDVAMTGRRAGGGGGSSRLIGCGALSVEGWSRLEATCAQFHCTRLARKALQALRDEAALRKTKVAGADALRRRSFSRWVWRAWSGAMRERSVCAVAHHERFLRMRAVRAWVMFMRERACLLWRITAFQEKRQLWLLARSLRAWRHETMRRQVCRQTVECHLALTACHRRRAAWSGWRAFVTCRRATSAAEAWHLRALRVRCWRRWRHMAHSCSLLRRVFAAAERRWEEAAGGVSHACEFQLALRALLTWRRATEQHLARREEHVRCHMAYTHRRTALLVRAFSTLRAPVDASRLRAAVREHLRAVLLSWCAWAVRPGRRPRARPPPAMRRRHGVRSVYAFARWRALACAFATWRNLGPSLKRRAAAFRVRSASARALQGLREAAAEAAHDMRTSAEMRRRTLLRSALDTWRVWWAWRAALREKERTLVHSSTTALQRKAMRAWAAVLAYRRERARFEATATSHFAQRLLRKCLRQWLADASHCKKWRRAVEHAQARSKRTALAALRAAAASSSASSVSASAEAIAPAAASGSGSEGRRTGAAAVAAARTSPGPPPKLLPPRPPTAIPLQHQKRTKSKKRPNDQPRRQREEEQGTSEESAPRSRERRRVETANRGNGGGSSRGEEVQAAGGGPSDHSCFGNFSEVIRNKSGGNSSATPVLTDGPISAPRPATLPGATDSAVEVLSSNLSDGVDSLWTSMAALRSLHGGHHHRQQHQQQQRPEDANWRDDDDGEDDVAGSTAVEPGSVQELPNNAEVGGGREGDGGEAATVFYSMIASSNGARRKSRGEATTSPSPRRRRGRRRKEGGGMGKKRKGCLWAASEVISAGTGKSKHALGSRLTEMGPVTARGGEEAAKKIGRGVGLVPSFLAVEIRSKKGHGRGKVSRREQREEGEGRKRGRGMVAEETRRGDIERMGAKEGGGYERGGRIGGVEMEGQEQRGLYKPLPVASKVGGRGVVAVGYAVRGGGGGSEERMRRGPGGVVSYSFSSLGRRVVSREESSRRLLLSVHGRQDTSGGVERVASAMDGGRGGGVLRWLGDENRREVVKSLNAMQMHWQ